MKKLVLALSAALAVCVAAGAAAAEGESDAARKAIEAANRTLSEAVARGDAAAVAGLYTENAQILPPNGQAVSGRAAIEAFWKSGGAFSLALHTLDVEATGDVAVEVGTYTVSGPDGAALEEGKYVVVWRREKGAWRLHRDIWNTSRPERTP